MCSPAIVEKITNFRTTLGGKIISLDLFDSDFDFDRFTLWISLDDPKERATRPRALGDGMKASNFSCITNNSLLSTHLCG